MIGKENNLGKTVDTQERREVSPGAECIGKALHGEVILRG